MASLSRPLVLCPVAMMFVFLPWYLEKLGESRPSVPGPELPNSPPKKNNNKKISRKYPTP